MFCELTSMIIGGYNNEYQLSKMFYIRSYWKPRAGASALIDSAPLGSTPSNNAFRTFSDVAGVGY